MLCQDAVLSALISIFRKKEKIAENQVWGVGRLIVQRIFMMNKLCCLAAIVAKYLYSVHDSPFDLNAKIKSARLHRNWKKPLSITWYWIELSCFFWAWRWFASLWWLIICPNVVALNSTLVFRYDLLRECFVIAGLFKELQANVHSIWSSNEEQLQLDTCSIFQSKCRYEPIEISASSASSLTAIQWFACLRSLIF